MPKPFDEEEFWEREKREKHDTFFDRAANDDGAPIEPPTCGCLCGCSVSVECEDDICEDCEIGLCEDDDEDFDPET